jgi:hypothetical protein
MRPGYPIEDRCKKITKQNSQLSKIKKIKKNSDQMNEDQIWYKNQLK